MTPKAAKVPSIFSHTSKVLLFCVGIVLAVSLIVFDLVTPWILVAIFGGTFIAVDLLLDGRTAIQKGRSLRKDPTLLFWAAPTRAGIPLLLWLPYLISYFIYSLLIKVPYYAAWNFVLAVSMLVWRRNEAQDVPSEDA